MRRHNLITVIGFEVRRTLGKPQFWVATLAVPATLILFVGLILASNTAAAASDRESWSQRVAFTYTDASGLVRADVAARLGGRPSTDAAADAAAVRQGRADLFIAYPADPRVERVSVVARDIGLTDNVRYQVVASSLLRESAVEAIGDPRLTTLATTAPRLSLTAWRDGAPAPGWDSVIVPGAFMALLFLTVLLPGAQMLNITVEEKESRVTEMILTTIHPTTLILGKVVAVLAVAVVQVLVSGVPVLGVLALFPGVLQATDATGAIVQVPLPTVDELVVPLGVVLLAALLFVGGLLMFVGLLVAIGSVMPTARDASGAFSIVLISMLLPMYAGALVLSEPHGVVSRTMTFFPLTAPVTALLRNATGSLGPLEGALVLAVIMACAALFLGVGVSLFREGSISYGVRLPLRKALRRLTRS